MKKHILPLLLISLFRFPAIYAQIGDTTYIPVPYTTQFMADMADTCDYPAVMLSSVIQYSEGPAVYLQLSESVSDVRLKRDDELVFTTISFASTSKLIRHLAADHVYDIQVRDRCGEYVSIGSVNTASNATEEIEVSIEMYEAIRDFQTQPAPYMPFDDFIAARQDVDFFEKVYFIQRYYMNGQLISAYSDTDLPDFMPPTICNCRFVFNMTQVAVPGKMVDGSIIAKILNQPKKQMSGNSYNAAWWDRQTKGAAKWHHLWTEGSKAGGSDHTYTMKMGDSTAVIGTQYGKLRYNLFCQNFDIIPADCQCQKQLWLYWRYDTEVCAHAEEHSEGNGSRNAVAAAEDIGIAVLRREGTNQPKILKGSAIARAAAECDRTVNSDFWANAANVALNIAGIAFTLPKDTLNESGKQIFKLSLEGLASSITKLINTPYYSSQNCDANACKEITAAYGDTLVYMKPNEPISLILFSNSSLMAGGRRSWFSWSRIASDFYLTGYVPGGYPSEDQMHCCTKKYANWVLAAGSEAPHNTDDLKLEVGETLSAWKPWPLPVDPFSNIITIPYEYHSMFVPVEDCPNGGSATGEGEDRSISANDQSTTISEVVYDIRVFDIQGRLLLRKMQSTLPINYPIWLADNLPAFIDGFYLVHSTSGDDQRLVKVFLHH